MVVDLRGHGQQHRLGHRRSIYRLLPRTSWGLDQALHLKKPAIVGWGRGATWAGNWRCAIPSASARLVAFGLTYDRTASARAPTRPDLHRLRPRRGGRLSAPRPVFTEIRGTLATGGLWASEPTTARRPGGDQGPADHHGRRSTTNGCAGPHEGGARLIPNPMSSCRGASHFAPGNPQAVNDTLKLLLRN